MLAEHSVQNRGFSTISPQETIIHDFQNKSKNAKEVRLPLESNRCPDVRGEEGVRPIVDVCPSGYHLTGPVELRGKYGR